MAVFGFLIGGLLGFLPWGVQGVGKVREQNVAYGLIDGVQVELERMGFSLVERGTMRWTNPTNPQPVPPWNVLLVARKVGGQVEFEQVIESEESKMNTSDERKRVRCNNLGKAFRGTNVPFNESTDGKPISLLGLESFKSIALFPKMDPQGERYFLISAPNTRLAIVISIIPATASALQIGVQWPYKLPDPSKGTDGFRRVEERYRSHFAFHWP